MNVRSCLRIIVGGGSRNDRHILKWLNGGFIRIAIGSPKTGIEDNEVLSQATRISISIAFIVCCCVHWWVGPLLHT